MEQRKYRRFSDQSFVTFCNDSIEGEGRLGNLSLGGAAVFSDVAIARGSYVAMTITFTNTADTIAIDLAPVRWVKDGSFGVEFIRISDESQRRLKQYVDALDKTAQAA